MGRVSVTVISLVSEYKPAGKEGWMFTLLSSSNSVGKRLKNQFVLTSSNTSSAVVPHIVCVVCVWVVKPSS